MADLYQAYGEAEENGPSYFDNVNDQQYNDKNRQKEIQQYQNQSQQQIPQPVQQSIQQPDNPNLPRVSSHNGSYKEGFQNSQLYELKNYEKQYSSNKSNISYSFWERMVVKRPEIIKLAVFSLVIVMAISLEKVGTHYLSKYLSENIFTDLQELMIRFSLPIGVLLLIWVIKSL